MQAQIEVLDFGTICRACFSSENELNEIKSGARGCNTSLHLFEKCTSIKLDELPLPIFICNLCMAHVNSWKMFRDNCLQTHIKFKRIFEELCSIEEQCETITIIKQEEETIANKEFENFNEIIKFHEMKNEEVESNENISLVEDPCSFEEKKAMGAMCTKEVNQDDCDKHIQEKHEINFTCDLCNIVFPEAVLLNEHIRIEHNDHISDDKNWNRHFRQYSCNMCNKTYTSRKNLQIHKYSHAGIKPLKCNYCQRGFTKQASLNDHITIHTGMRDHLCTECGKGYTSQLALNRHMAIHKADRPHKCNYCPATFLSTGDLNVHIRSHTGEKPYLCATCGKSFRRTTHLIVHKRIHTGEKPFKCLQCGKCFAQSGDLTAHRRVHTGEKPFICTVCHKKFNQGGALAKHMKGHMNLQFTCEICEKKFTQASVLSNHMLIHSNN